MCNIKQKVTKKPNKTNKNINTDNRIVVTREERECRDSNVGKRGQICGNERKLDFGC